MEFLTENDFIELDRIYQKCFRYKFIREILENEKAERKKTRLINNKYDIYDTEDLLLTLEKTSQGDEFIMKLVAGNNRKNQLASYNK